MKRRVEIMVVSSDQDANIQFLVENMHAPIDRTLSTAVRAGFKIEELFVLVDSTGFTDSICVLAVTKEKMFQAKNCSERFARLREQLVELEPVSGSVRTMYLAPGEHALGYFVPVLADVCNAKGGEA